MKASLFDPKAQIERLNTEEALASACKDWTKAAQIVRRRATLKSFVEPKMRTYRGRVVA